MEQHLPSLEDLQTFLIVAAEGSVTAAARKLGMPKSTISRRLTRLEETVGVTLVQRTTRKLLLTDDGHAFHEQVGRALTGLEEATIFLRDRRETPRGHVRLTAPYDIGNRNLADVVAEYTERYPETTVEVLLTERMVDLVGEGVDLAVRASGALPDSTMVARKIATGVFGLFASEAYLEKHGTPRNVKQLAKHEFVMMRATQGHQRLSLEGPHGTETIEAHVKVTASEMSFVQRATLKGLGIGVLPDFVEDTGGRDARLVRVLPGFTAGKGTVFVVHPGGRLLPARVRAMRDLLIERLALPEPKGHRAQGD
ncbi:MAG: LysR family transcriptional regulator [Myxococcaceae bacterium]|nr:LysR family transcriptional regulator [Myxococcaceae bacterium]